MRLFVGIPLPVDVRECLARMSSGLKGARWISPENMHITLRFIGEVDGHMAEDIDTTLIAMAAPGFDLSLNAAGMFGRGHLVHTVWADVKPEPALNRLQAKVEQAMVRLGLEPEHRKYTPHVTLARLKKVTSQKIADWAEANAGFRAGPFRVDAFVLFRSHLGHGPAHYETLSEYPLKTEFF